MDEIQLKAGGLPANTLYNSREADLEIRRIYPAEESLKERVVSAGGSTAPVSAVFFALAMREKK